MTHLDTKIFLLELFVHPFFPSIDLIMIMADKQEVSPFLRRPLYVFDLPPELLLSLHVANPSEQQRQQVTEFDQDESARDRIAPNEEGAKSTSCKLCQVVFKNVQDQRQHVKSDFHKYNLKLSLKQMPSVDEATFIRMIGDLDESISGSEASESDNEDTAKDDPLSTLLRKQAKLTHVKNDAQMDASQKRVAGNAPMIWMSSPKIGNEHVLGAYRAIFSAEDQDAMDQSTQQTLQKKQLTPTQAKHSGKSQTNGTPSSSSDPHYFLCMIGGGHFAAMIVSLVPEIRRGPGGVEERHAVIHAHKTFHRYTTRRKQGGSQSANDNAKGNAHSVGSSIRRANEAALEAEVRAILSEWRSMIDSSELLFVRATGSTNRRTLFGPYDGQILNSRDKRLRGFPFSTRRATQAELLRSFQELTRLKVSKVVEVTTEAPKPESTTSSKPPKPKAETPKLSEEESTAQLHTTQLQTLIRRSRAPALLLYLSKNAISPNFLFYPSSSPENHHAPTPLHLASSTNSPALITALLKANADPTLTNADGKTAYDLAGDQRTRDAFRVARNTLGEEAFDWNAAHVPSAISQAEADTRAKEEQSALESAEKERRKADLRDIEKAEEDRNVGRLERKAGVGKSLSAAQEKTGGEKREEETRGLTPEMRMKLERERRARAAEERMRRMGGGR